MPFYGECSHTTVSASLRDHQGSLKLETAPVKSITFVSSLRYTSSPLEIASGRLAVEVVRCVMVSSKPSCALARAYRRDHAFDILTAGTAVYYSG